MSRSASRAFGWLAVPTAASLLGLALLPGPAPLGAAPVVAAITIPTDDDFATQALGDPWDMNNREDIAFEFTRDSGPLGLANLQISGGVLTAQATTNDPGLYLRVPSNAKTNPTPRDGAFAPIDTGAYRYLTTRMFLDATNAQNNPFGANVLAERSESTGIAVMADESAREGWNIITFDLSEKGLWTGAYQGLRLTPMGSTGSFTIDFVQLSSQLRTVAISVPAGGPNRDIYVGTADDGSDGALIASNVTPDSTFNWQTALAAGTYYATFRNAGTDTPNGAAFQITANATPITRITAPSYISGPDYATVELGNAWDFSDASDVRTFWKVKNGQVSNGVASGTNDLGAGSTFKGDPGIYLNLSRDGSTVQINTSTYKYITYRLLVDGPQNTTNGSVARILWNHGGVQISTSWDIVVYEGYQTVSFDLNSLGLEDPPGSPVKQPWSSRSRASEFRFDPHEFGTVTNEERRFEVDYILLTGDDVARGLYAIRYQVSDADGSPTPTFHFDGDRTGFNGTQITCTSVGVPVGTPRVFLPALTQFSTPAVVPQGATCLWDTTGVANGTYYIYAITSDGTNTYRIYSQTPVVVQN